MINIDEIRTFGWEPAIRGMRNPMNSWKKSDSESGCELAPGSHELCRECNDAVCMQVIGPADHELMMKLAKNGSVHAKYRRMIVVYMDITAPLYWWKEFDTYKVGTVANSCSTMHKIQEKEFKTDDFSCEHLDYAPSMLFQGLIDLLNDYRNRFLENHDKNDWWQMIQLLPSSYNQKRTVMLNYEVLSNIYASRKNHKLDEWRDFCSEIEKLPYSEIITLHDPDYTFSFTIDKEDQMDNPVRKPLYLCNPDLAKENCSQTGCHLNGGLCELTTNPDFRQN